MFHKKDSPQCQGHTQAESEGIEKDIPCTWKLKQVQLYFCETKQTNMRQRKPPCNDKGVNPTRRCNNYDYISIPKRKPKYIKQI